MSTVNEMDKKPIRIKQMMPIPEGFEVMNTIVQEDGREEMETTVDSLSPFCLAFVEDKNYGDRIELYELGSFGNGIQDCFQVILVPTRHCPKCEFRI